MKVLITETAWNDMLEIARAISRDNPARADLFLDELFERCSALAWMPRAFPLLPGHEESGVRRRPFGNYLIFYRVQGSRVEVVHVLHGARDYDRILFPDE